MDRASVHPDGVFGTGSALPERFQTAANTNRLSGEGVDPSAFEVSVVTIDEVPFGVADWASATAKP